MIDTTPDQPLVTFALFSYNQEQYIYEALEGAFSQTYEPLEIILSDDCSGDRTFEIMQEEAKKYTGPHKITLRRNAHNRGIFRHVRDVMEAAQGQYIVVAAADDISVPTRTEELVKVMIAGFWAVSGSYVEIDEKSEELREVIHTENDLVSTTFGGELHNIHGGTAGYRTELVDFLVEPSTNIFLEDFVISMVLARKNLPVATCGIPLIKHRIHTGNVGVKESFLITEPVDVVERKITRKFAQTADALDYLLTCLKGEQQTGDAEYQKLATYAHIFRLRSQWIEGGLGIRIRILSVARKYDFFKWALLRLFGLETYISILKLKRLMRSPLSKTGQTGVGTHS